jgi:hypothetical protein
MSFKQYENFMDIQQKTKSPGWTSEQLNFIVGSKTINEKAMDTNLEKIGINQENKKKIKDATVNKNIHSLLNILKAYNANVHQDKPRPANTDSMARLQLAVDTRQALGKRPACEHQSHKELHTHSPPPNEKESGRPNTPTSRVRIPLPNTPSRLHRGAHTR